MEKRTPLRILQIVSSSATSGAERNVYSLSKLLTAHGHHVEVVCPGPGWLPSVLRDLGVEVHIKDMRGMGWYRCVGFLIRHARQNRFDLIHTHLTRAAYAGFSAGLLGHIPVVTSVHIANNDLVYRRLARGDNRLVAVSDFVRGMLHGLGISQKYIDTIYNGTDFGDFESFSPEAVKDEFGIPRERRVVGLVGKVCREKGHLEMIEAMMSVRKSHPDTHLVFVGSIEESFRLEIERAIAVAGIGDRLTMTGIRHDVPRLLDSFTLSAVPSHVETFGVAAIEAMARSKAVVAARVGGLPEVVHHRQTGLLVDLSPGELAEAVNYLLEHDAERERMGAMGRLVVEQKFTLNEMYRRFENLYTRVAASSSR